MYTNISLLPAPYSNTTYFNPLPLLFSNLHPYSICPMGYHSPNKIAKKEILLQWTAQQERTPEQEKAVVDLATTYFARKEIGTNIKWYEKYLIQYLSEQSFKIPEIWKNYAIRLITVAELSQLTVLDLGNCQEAAYYSISKSLVKQLNTGHRETIQLINLSGDNPDAGHAFVIYNSKLFPAFIKLDPTSDDLVHFFKNLTPANPHDPIICCDAWANFHGVASHLLPHLKNLKDPLLKSNQWNKITITDYSIPPLRNNSEESNHKVRNFLKRLSIAILENKLDYECLTHKQKSQFCFPSN